MLKGQAEGTTPILHTQHCLSSHISEGENLEFVIVSFIIVSSMCNNGWSPEQTALEHCINP